MAGCGSKAPEEVAAVGDNKVATVESSVSTEEVIQEEKVDVETVVSSEETNQEISKSINSDKGYDLRDETELNLFVNTAKPEIGSTSFINEIKPNYTYEDFKRLTMVYLGHPRIMEEYENYEGNWFSSNKEIATAENGIITGWSEGICQITLENKEGDVIDVFDVVVTTFNDGRDVKNYRVYDYTDYFADDASYTPHDPEWVRENCNTILDFVIYLYDRYFVYNPDAPIMVTGETCWTWAESGDIVLMNNHGVCCDVANAASYVLANDYERWGFVCITGACGHIYNWFYEDGKYYIIDFTTVISDNRNDTRTFDPRKYINCVIEASNDEDAKEKIQDYLLKNTNIAEHTLLTFWVDSTGYDFQPAIVLSWCHEGIEADNKYVALEKDTLENRTIMGYINPDEDVEVRGIETDDIPSIVPTYGIRSNQDEIDKWNKYYRY